MKFRKDEEEGGTIILYPLYPNLLTLSESVVGVPIGMLNMIASKSWFNTSNNNPSSEQLQKEVRILHT